MTFAFRGYEKLLDLLSENGYKITDYHNWEKYDKCVILRHDVDTDMQKALEMAELEYRHGVTSTYFVLLTSNFYNLYSCRNRKIVNEIQHMGHTVGLHFDEMAYPEDVGNADKVTENIKKEIKVLAEILERNVTAFSYHRPTKAILDTDIKIEGAINSYGNLFFRQFKYLSDSRMHWREPVLDIIKKNEYPQLQILTHPFWYYDEEKEIKEILYDFINRADIERYNNLNDNFTSLRDIIEWENCSK